MKEDAEVDLDSLNKSQLYKLLQLGEIDSFTYSECVEDIKLKRALRYEEYKNNSLLWKIIRFFSNIFKTKRRMSYEPMDDTIR